MLTIYCDYHTPTIRYATHDGADYIIPATSTGWSDRRPWTPSPLVRRQIMTDANRVDLHSAWWADACLGIPADVYNAQDTGQTA